MPGVTTDLVTDNRWVRCPTCRQSFCVQVREARHNAETDRISGEASCHQCETVALVDRNHYQHSHLTFEFLWDMFSGVMEVTGGGDSPVYRYPQYYEQGEQPMPTAFRPTFRPMSSAMSPDQPARHNQTVYAVTSGKGKDYHLVLTTASRSYANTVKDLRSSSSSNMQIEEFDPRGEFPSGYADQIFPVYVVSVGMGEHYRIIEILVDQKRAHKIAGSLRGRVAKFECVPGNSVSQSVCFQKYFVVLGEDRDHYEESSNGTAFHADNFHRQLQLHCGEEVMPIITRRRRYNRSLPYRLEVASPSHETASEIARMFNGQYEDGKLDLDSFEYNVDYQLVQNPEGKWEIDPKLLLANNVQ